MKLIKRLGIFLIVFSSSFGWALDSTCYGTVSKGRLENGVKLPSGGNNFESYSGLAESLGRTYVHSEVEEILLASYKQLASENPEFFFKFGETGFKNGGEFRPHKTHQNGLSVDFFVPVTKEGSDQRTLPTNLLNKWGYNIEFDKQGRYRNLLIDFPAIVRHLTVLHKTAQENEAEIDRVFFDPALREILLAAPGGDYLRENIQFNEQEAWVRHDEHYHVDFKIPCEPLESYR